jgi:hypothetical protein
MSDRITLEECRREINNALYGLGDHQEKDCRLRKFMLRLERQVEAAVVGGIINGGLMVQQGRQIRQTGEVTCPCGRTVVETAFAYRCFHCGVWFCNSCMRKHVE